MSNSLFKRRTLLKQLGAASFLAVPVFRSTLSEAQAVAPKRLLLFALHGGIPWYLDKEEPDLSWTGPMSALKAFESDITFVRDVTNQATQKIQAEMRGDGHNGGTRSMFTGGSVDAKLHSLDHIVADQIGVHSRVSSLQVGVVTDGGEGQEGLFQGLTNRRTSYRNGQPIRPDQDPTALFGRLFSGMAPAPTPGATGDPQAQLAAQNRYQRGKSLLDHLIGQVTSIQAIAGVGEQAKLDQHLTALRELEKGLQDSSGTAGGGGSVAPAPGAGCMAPSISGKPGFVQGTSVNGGPGLAQADIVQIGQDMNQLTYQALNCDLTRVVSFQWFSSGDQVMSYPWLNINDTHHGLEHSSVDRDDPNMRVKLNKLQEWTLGQVGGVLDLLKKTPEGNGNMLDNSLALISFDMSTGDHVGEPHILMAIGGAGGAVKKGQTVNMGMRRHNDALLGFAAALGVNISTIGDPELCTTPFNFG